MFAAMVLHKHNKQNNGNNSNNHHHHHHHHQQQHHNNHHTRNNNTSGTSNNFNNNHINNNVSNVNQAFGARTNSHEEPFILSWHPFFLTPRKSRLGDGSSHGIEVGGSLVNAEIGMIPKTLLTTRSRLSGMIQRSGPPYAEDFVIRLEVEWDGMGWDGIGWGDKVGEGQIGHFCLLGWWLCDRFRKGFEFERGSLVAVCG
uniref:Uncharacterized protein n=1 Tax=Vespula pensylvanica TaxID=30213 RepID=A0A834PGZ4_VESPE|nr:hypothetical protein H0235_001781 [Vespula pensylvanica]